MSRMYIAGGMTGYPELNFPAFHREAAYFREQGHEVINPAEVNPGPTAKWVDCMKMDIPALLTCDAIAMLPGYETSRGACLELTIAMSLGMEVLYVGQNPVAAGGIYAIRGPGGRRYIGQAKSFTRRWTEHRSALNNGRHHCASLQRAWKKYGEEAFAFERMFVVPAGKDRNDVEQQWLDILGRVGLYNSALQVLAPQLGRKHSLATKAKMSASHKGARNHNFGKTLAAETKRLLSEAAHRRKAAGHLGCSGMAKSEEHRKKLSIALTGKMAVLDNLSYFLDAVETKLPPPRMVDDKQAFDAPLKGILLLSPASYNSLITDISSTTSNLRAYQAAAMERAKYSGNHPIFMGEAGIWRGILVKKIEHSIKFETSTSYQYVTVANRLTETETAGTVSATLSTTHSMERGILLGAQALARAEGASNSGVQAAIIENTYNAGRNYEYLGEFMGGEAKFRFQFPNENGDLEYTDNGVYAIDAAVPKLYA